MHVYHMHISFNMNVFVEHVMHASKYAYCIKKPL